MLAVVFIAALAAVPPLPPFPSELRPVDGSTAPSNASLFALGDPAPPLGQIGFTALVDGGAAALGTPEAVGCCVIRVPLASEPAVGAAVTFNITSPNGDSSTTWTVGAHDDVTPTLTAAPVVIDHSEVDDTHEQLIIGVSAADDGQVGMVTARLPDGTLVGVTVDGFTLQATAPVSIGHACVDVAVTDVAGNESGATPVCVDVTRGAEGEGEGDGFDDAEECEGPGGVPVNVPSTSVVLVLLAALSVVRRPR